jgi:ZIP family zinc transporter
MSEMTAIALYCWLSGLAMFVGAILAAAVPLGKGEIGREILHGIVAFGGGVLVAAVAFVLAPTGLEALSAAPAALYFCGGAVAFMFLDKAVSNYGGSRAQLMAMLLDFIPEAMALGAVFAHQHALGILLALFIGVQNLPEGFNAFREAIRSGRRSTRVLTTMFVLSFLGPAAGLTGRVVLATHHEQVAGLMLLAAGGILYLIFQDIAPQARMKRHWAPPLGATLGFILGMIGEKVLG